VAGGRWPVKGRGVLHEAWSSAATVTKLKADAESARVFLPGGQAPMEGELFRNPDLSHALRLIADKGRDAFYKGDIAAALLRTSERLKGTMTAEDLASYSAEWVEPISIDYRGWRVYELPPNGQGMAALEMLNLMETVAPSPLGAFSAAEMHKRIEAMKLAYADLRRYDADPRTYDVPVRFQKSWRNASTSLRRGGRRRTRFVPPVVCGHRAGCGTASVTAAGSNGGIGSPPEVEMFPVFPVLLPVCSQSWRNGFLKFPVFRISCADHY
jgi:gamma-glutamyltranspeptidase/glutathione hydrolase